MRCDQNSSCLLPEMFERILCQCSCDRIFVSCLLCEICILQHPHIHTDSYLFGHSPKLSSCYLLPKGAGGDNTQNTHGIITIPRFNIHAKSTLYHNASWVLCLCNFCFWYCFVVSPFLACPAHFHRPISITQRSRQRHRFVHSPPKRRQPGKKQTHCPPTVFFFFITTERDVANFGTQLHKQSLPIWLKRGITYVNESECVRRIDMRWMYHLF